MCNLILFGAGASFGSDESTLVPPPGAKLFDALSKFNPTAWGAVDDSFAGQFRTDFEQGMKAFAEANPTNVDILQRAMAAYFFQFQPKSSSLYVRMAQRIRACNWSGALASINYERLLELAIRSTGTNMLVGRAPEPGDGVELCLPHGCCHLFGQIRASGNVVFDAAIRLDSPGIRMIENPQEHTTELEQSTVPPIMSYIQPGKETRAGNPFLCGQRRRFAELVQAAQAVVIIGVKVRPLDTHIWDSLRETSARIIYCSGKQAADTFLSWSAGAGRQHDDVLPFYWTEAFDNLCSRIGIA